MKNRTVAITLLTSTVLALGNILLSYYLAGRNPVNRLGYGIFISVVPALAAFVWIRLKHVSWSWQQIAAAYVVLYVAVSTIQGYARMIPVHQIVERVVP